MNIRWMDSWMHGLQGCTWMYVDAIRCMWLHRAAFGNLWVMAHGCGCQRMSQKVGKVGWMKGRNLQ